MASTTPLNEQIPGTVITVDNRKYTTPVFQGINTNEFWHGSCQDYTLTDKAENPHARAGEMPQKFWIEAGALILFLRSCMGLDGPKDGKELYELASQDRWYSYDQTFQSNGNKMSWYKFNRTYTENLTRYKGKGVSFCTRGNITDAGSVPRAEDASCMISYMYNSDPKETLDVLVKLLKEKVIAEDERIFFCSFANFQVNHNKFPTESHGDLYCRDAPTVSDQVQENPFAKIAGFVDKFVIMHTGGETDIYSRKWCCFELSKAMEKVEKDDNTKMIMVGSEAYREKVVAAISRFDPNSFQREYDAAANEEDIPRAWKDLMEPLNLSPEELTLMQVLAPADTKNSIAQENQPPENPRVKGPINAMLDESIESIVAGKLDPRTQMAIPGEVVEGFLAANLLINSIRMRYQASILTGGSGLVQYVSSANRPNAIPGGNVIFAGDVTQVIAEEGTAGRVIRKQSSEVFSLAYDGSLEQDDREVPRNPVSNKEVVAAINGVRAAVKELVDAVGVDYLEQRDREAPRSRVPEDSIYAIEDDLDDQRERIIAMENKLDKLERAMAMAEARHEESLKNLRIRNARNKKRREDRNNNNSEEGSVYYT